MKILQAISYFAPQKGGDLNVCCTLSKQLAQHAHEVTIITTDSSGFDKEYARSIEEFGVEVIPFHCIVNINSFLITPSMNGWVKSNISNFDLVHMHNFRSYQNSTIHHYAKKYSVPYVLQAHGSLPEAFTGQSSSLIFQKKLFDMVFGETILKDASKVIASTKIESGQYQKMGVNEDKIEIVPSGLDLSQFENLPQRGRFRKKWGINDGQKIILYLARIAKVKGLDLLANAFAGLTKKLDDAKLVIVGPDDGYLLSLKKLIADLEISDKVLFTGPLYGNDKLEAYVDADVYVLPSSYEIFGITILEALACGTPVIVTDRCGLADVINGQAGLVVPYEKEELQHALLQMLGDDKMRREFGERGKLLVREKFNWEKIAEQIENVYQSVTVLDFKEGSDFGSHK